MTNVFEDAAIALLELAKSLPETSPTRSLVGKAAQTAVAESFLDESGRVTDHPFRARSTRVPNRAFCAECTWHRDKHGPADARVLLVGSDDPAGPGRKVRVVDEDGNVLAEQG